MRPSMPVSVAARVGPRAAARSLVPVGALALGALLAASGAAAVDTVRVGVNPVSASLPLYVGIGKGFFKDLGIDIETTKLVGGPANVAALISNQIDAAANMVTIEGINADIKKPGCAMYIAINSQNAKHVMEQFVARTGVDVKVLADFKGKKLFVAPGPANVTMARAVLLANGLREGDYTLDQLDIAQHVGALAAGTFDGGYTLEPPGSVMRKNNVARTIEAGLIAKYILGDRDANGYAAGTVVTQEFLNGRPDLAKRFAQGWERAIAFIKNNPDEARTYLVGNTLTPPDIATTIPLVGFTMVKDLTPANIAEFQKFIDFSSDNKILSTRVDVTKFMARF
jgi:NitT/TauT family transport system substrate-binding protein